MRTLGYSSRGPSVQLLQLALDRAGYGPLERDGIFGARTADALRRFQTANALVPDAVAGRQTHAVLMPWYTGYLRHRMRPGESFYSLSRLYGTDAAAIELANPTLRPTAVPVGAAVTVPLPFDVVPTDVAYGSALTALCVRGLCARYPFITCSSIGRSVMGRPLWRLSMGTGENRVAYSAAYHANESITTPILLKFAEELAAAYASGGAIFAQSAAELLDYARLSLVPLIDPDGVDLVTGDLQSGRFHTGAAAIAARYPALPFPSGWKANIMGTDLNLQFPALWDTAREIKAAAGVTGPAPANFVGAAPLSAPESRAIYDHTLAFDPSLVIALHTQGEVIYWRFEDLEPPVSRDIVGTFSAVSGYAAADTPYSASFAGYKDWFIQSFRRPGFTVEAGRGVNPLPISDFDGIYARVRGILTLGALVT